MSFRFLNDDVIASDRHEPGVLALLNGEGDTFVDIGAHVGKYAVRLAGRFRSVVAVEPDAANREVLAENLRLNGLENVTVLPVAAWDSECDLTFVSEGPQSRIADGAASVRAVRLDDWLTPKVDLVKVDVEGAEAHALAGMADTLRRDRPRVVVEMHDRTHDLPNLPGEVAAVLESVGYGWREAYEWGPSHYWLCEPVGP